MMRINLLPPEILERRKSERRVVWALVAAIGVALVLVGVWSFAHMRLSDKERELAQLEQLVQSTEAQAEQLAIFEARASELESRRLVAEVALGDRRNWGKLYDELSLVLPADVWLQMMTASEDEGLVLNGYALDSATDSPDSGHKPIAKTLVRLADLKDLYDVWLTNSAKATYLEQPVIQFSLTAGVASPVEDEVTP